MGIEDRLRKTLSRQASTVRPSDDAWLSIEGRIWQKQRSPIPRMLVAVGALSLSALSITGLWFVFWSGVRPDPISTDATRTTRDGPVISKAISVGAFPRAIALGEGVVWVSVQEDGPMSRVVGLDRQSGDVVASIGVEVAPDHVAVGGGSLWGSVEGENGSILRIDLVQERVTTRIPVRGSYVQDIASDGDSVWVALVDVEDGSSSVGKIDTETNQIVSVVALPRFVVDIEVSDGVLWILDSEVRGSSIMGDGHVTRIDASSGEMLGSTDVRASGTRILVTSDDVWVQSWLSSHVDVGSGATDQVVALRLNRQTGGVRGSPIPVEGSFNPFGFDGEGVWFFGENGRGDGFVLSRLNSISQLVDHRLDLTAEPVDAALDAGPNTTSIWVANYEGSVTHVALGS